MEQGKEDGGSDLYLESKAIDAYESSRIEQCWQQLSSSSTAVLITSAVTLSAVQTGSQCQQSKAQRQLSCHAGATTRGRWWSVSGQRSCRRDTVAVAPASRPTAIDSAAASRIPKRGRRAAIHHWRRRPQLNGCPSDGACNGPTVQPAAPASADSQSSRILRPNTRRHSVRTRAVQLRCSGFASARSAASACQVCVAACGVCAARL
jgi:hypothetical protein